MSIKKKVNADFFKIWTSDMAYVLGFFYADGTFDITARGSYYFGFHICDRILLFKIRKTMDSNHKIAERKVLENESRRYRLQIGSKAMCADLLRIGVKQRKTKRIRLPKIPDMFALDFVRGYFDGDGHVWTGTMYQLRKTPHVTIQVGFTSSSKEFLLDLHDLLHTKGLVGGGVYCKKDAFCIKYSASDSIRLYTLMYGKLGSSKLFLPRKKRIFERYESRKRAKVLRS